MRDIVREIDSLRLTRAKPDPEIQTTLDVEKVILQLKRREEMPNAYLLFLKDLDGDSDYRKIVTVKILRLYVHARSQYRGDSKSIKNWLLAGKLPAEKYGARASMSTLYRRLKSFSKNIEVKNNIDEEIEVLLEKQKSQKDFSKRGEVSYYKKEIRLTVVESNLSSLKDQILAILEKFETLIAPRSDK